MRTGAVVLQVVIDDRLPMGQHGGLLCSYSSNGDEFWISLIEKAYMKVTRPSVAQQLCAQHGTRMMGTV